MAQVSSSLEPVSDLAVVKSTPVIVMANRSASSHDLTDGAMEETSSVEPAEERAPEATSVDDGGHSVEPESPSRTEV